MNDVEITIYEDLEELSSAAASAFVHLATAVIEKRGRFIAALSGGSTPARLYQLLATLPYRPKMFWENVILFWGDERLVPPQQVESNYGQTEKILLRHVGIRSENVFRIRGELQAELAAQDYAQKLQSISEANLSWPVFDLALLGLGEDGHIASIFPGAELDLDSNSPVRAVLGGYQGRPAERITLTPTVFNTSRNIWFLVTGAKKATVIAKVLEGNGNAFDLPALRINPAHGKVNWMVDKAAASKLSF